NKSGHYPWDELWFDRTDNSPSVYNGKFGAASYDWSAATNDNTKRNFNLAIGFNTTDVVNCNSFELTLPIVLKQFSVAKNNENIYINWITASEINNDFFTIEHSLDGVNFTEIKRINGAGNCNREISYSFIDKNAKEGINYYRLKQTDFDGKYTYSKVQAVYFDEIYINVEIYPNPVIGKVLNIKTNNTENTSINIYNCIGEKMGIKITNKNNIHIIDVSNLPKGIYFVETRVVGFSEYKKILIQ
ncbi:MAG: T9SS type A sorting domain-containing protein, partial [Bacteroidota bacterium]|nr:T9SS type A sorting domain-containing protein [Bacteroidota bacterium]